MMRAISLVCASLLVACGGGDDGGGDDGGGDDGGDHPLVGSWLETQLAGDDPTGRQTLAFHADGTLSRSTGEPRGEGTWVVTGDHVVLDLMFQGYRSVRDLGYVVAGEQLALGALFPVGTVDGLVGAWHGEFTWEGEHGVRDIELRADQTATDRLMSDTGLEELVGTWEVTDGDLLLYLDVPGGPGIVSSLKFIDGVALCRELYQRIP
jgi:hypothetical protein